MRESVKTFEDRRRIIRVFVQLLFVCFFSFLPFILRVIGTLLRGEMTFSGVVQKPLALAYRVIELQSPSLSLGGHHEEDGRIPGEDSDA